MAIIDGMIQEFDHEMELTRKSLGRAPEDKFDWKPREKAYSLGQLTSHIVESIGWTTVTMKQDEFDLDPDEWKPFQASSADELMEKLNENAVAAKAAMAGASDPAMMQTWKMTIKGNTVLEMPRVAVLRGMIFNHLIHHRGELQVYYRMLGVKVPAIYGPSGDEE